MEAETDLSVDRVTALLYVLLRDHVPFGTVTAVVAQIETHDGFDYTAAPVATYCRELAVRVLTPADPRH